MPGTPEPTPSTTDAPAAARPPRGVSLRAALLCGAALLAGGACIGVGVSGLHGAGSVRALEAAIAPVPTAPSSPAPVQPAAPPAAAPVAAVWGAGADAAPKPAEAPAPRHEESDPEAAADLAAAPDADRTAALERALMAGIAAAEKRLAALEAADAPPAPAVRLASADGGPVQVAQAQPAAAPPAPAVTAPQQQPDPLADVRRLLGEAERAGGGGAAAAEAPAWQARGEVERLKATQRDLTKLLEQALRSQLGTNRRLAELEVEHRAAMAGVQERLDTLNTRIAFAAGYGGVAAPDLDAVFANATEAARTFAQAPKPPRPAAAAAQPAAQPAPTWQARAAQGVQPPRSLSGPGGRCEVVEGSADVAQVSCKRPGQDRSDSRVVVRGTDIPGVGRVAAIRRAGRAWEVVLADGSVITQ